MLETLQETRPLPTVNELPLIGSLPALARDPLAFVRRVADECGDAGRFHLGPITGVLFNTPAAGRAVLVDQVDAFDRGTLTERAYHAVHNDPILIRQGEEHRRQRAILEPPFQPAQLASYAGRVVARSEAAVARWQNGAEIEVQAELRALTLAIAGDVLFGIDGLEAKDGLAAALGEIPEYLATAVKSPLLPPLWLPTPKNARVRGALALVQRQLQALIDDRRGRGLAGSDDLLTVMLDAKDAAGETLDDARVRDDAVEMFNAAHLNVATALAWCLYLLAVHPDAAAAARAEIDQALAERPPAFADLPKLPFTLQVIKEALRLYPPIYLLLPRRALEDVMIDGFGVKKGQLVLISPYTLHHRAEHFPEPERFDPQRFAPANEEAIPAYAFLPFSAGPHDCLGSHFALMEAQLVLASLLQRVELTLVPGQAIEPKPALVLQQRDGCRMVVRRT
jgi:cytochrome P450